MRIFSLSNLLSSANKPYQVRGFNFYLYWFKSVLRPFSSDYRKSSVSR
nr:MAG TPA: hypothetical protein [Caudoviricetes sp.]